MRLDTPPTFGEKLRTRLFFLFPHRWWSNLVFALTRLETRWKNPLINWYIRLFNVDMSEAKYPFPEDYVTFNAFFTRSLKDNARPIHSDPRTLSSPCDGVVLESGAVNENTLLQAKDEAYSLSRLIGTKQLAAPFAEGKFCTIYLSPGDYHRIHMPIDGRLLSMTHIPGRLFSVAPYTLEIIPQLYNRNERVTSIFETSLGRIAIVMVGAINVGCIETVWQGIVTPSSKRSTYLDYTGKSESEINLERGKEMGRFNLGSTVVLLSDNPNIKWNPKFSAGSPIQMGEELGCELDAAEKPTKQEPEKPTAKPAPTPTPVAKPDLQKSEAETSKAEQPSSEKESLPPAAKKPSPKPPQTQ